MAQVALRKVVKMFDKTPAVQGIDLDIADREFVVLVGPSGCGKTTTLRMVAGLEEASAGEIFIGDQLVNDVPPKDRDIAMVFQNYALYPHMSVYKNMAFSLKLRRRELGLNRAQIDAKVRETAALLGITDLLDRRPKALSGGQRQRVAVGRAIVRSPRAFLFDEPLSNLDAKLRVEMRSEIKRLQRRLRTTTIYVTHDQEEAMTLGDRVVVMKDGVVLQDAPPLEIYERPVNRFVAGFIGTPPMSFIDGRLTRSNGTTSFEDGATSLILDRRLAEAGAEYAGRPMVLGLRPDAFALEAVPGAARMSVRITLVETLGDRKDVYMTTRSGRPVVGRVDSRADVREGQEREMYVELCRVHLFEPGELGRNVTASAREAAVHAN